MAGRPATSWVHYITSCKHSLVLLKMGEIIARNMLSWLELLINRYCCIYLVVCIKWLILRLCDTELRGNVRTHWLVGYSVALSVAHVTIRRVVECLMSNKVESISIQAELAWFKVNIPAFFWWNLENPWKISALSKVCVSAEICTRHLKNES
jgi:hypothetical protein